MTTTYHATERLLRGVAAVIGWQPLDQNGDEANPGTVTVGVTRSNGDTVIAAGTATTGTGAARRLVALTVAQTAALDLLTATWTVSGTVVATTTHEVVGGVYLSSGEVRAADKSLANVVTYPADAIAVARNETENLFESVTGVAWVPRFAVERRSGTGTNQLILGWPQLRQVRWCRIYSSATIYDELDADELAAITPNRAGIAIRSDQSIWTAGVNNIVLGYEHGHNAPPPDLKKAAARTVRHLMNAMKSGVPDRATLMTLPEGGTVSLATPGLGIWHTGIPEVDETLRRYDHKTASIA